MVRFYSYLYTLAIPCTFTVRSLKADWSGGALPLLTGDNPEHTREGHSDRAKYSALPHNRGIEAESPCLETQPQGAQDQDTTKLSPFLMDIENRLKSAHWSWRDQCCTLSWVLGGTLQQSPWFVGNVGPILTKLWTLSAAITINGVKDAWYFVFFQVYVNMSKLHQIAKGKRHREVSLHTCVYLSINTVH